MVTIEGNIGVGKSSLAKQLSELCGWRPSYEPVETNPYLQKFYQAPERYGLEMQYWLLSQRFQAHQDAVEHVWRTGQPVVFDRSIYGDTVFARKLCLDGKIDEIGYTSYCHMRETMFRFLLTPQLTIYLDASPETCLMRIGARGRSCEQDIPLAYLQGLEACYQDLLEELQQRKSKVLRLNWNEFRPAEDVLGMVQDFLPQAFSDYAVIRRE
jgi:deoxyadenosine/deoxycytidine kinase